MVGGLNLVVELGFPADWYNQNDVRGEALDLIKDRGWQPILDSISIPQDRSESVIGKETVSNLFRTMPRVKRRIAEETGDRVARDPFVLWDSHCLRLRKAIEFILLTEVVLRSRLRRGKTQRRYHEYTGVEPSISSPERDAERVWDMMWLEPLSFQIENLPRDVDITAILNDTNIVQAFRNESGQGVASDAAEADFRTKGVLHWALKGGCGKFRTIEAAANAATKFHPNGAPSRAVTLNTADFRDRSKLRERHETPSQYETIFEDVRELGDPTRTVAMIKQIDTD